jgi:hypothetical protein
MRKVAYAIATCSAIIMASHEVASATMAKSLYARKWDECKELAKSRHFGIHWIKRNRWIKHCIVDTKSNRF